MRVSNPYESMFSSSITRSSRMMFQCKVPPSWCKLYYDFFHWLVFYEPSNIVFPADSISSQYLKYFSNFLFLKKYLHELCASTWDQCLQAYCVSDMFENTINKSYNNNDTLIYCLVFPGISLSALPLIIQVKS